MEGYLGPNRSVVKALGIAGSILSIGTLSLDKQIYGLKMGIQMAIGLLKLCRGIRNGS